MIEPKRVLFLSGLRLSPPLAGGHLRSLNFAKSLAREGHDVRIISLAARREDYKQLVQGTLLFELEPRLQEQVLLSLPFGLLQALSHHLQWPRFGQYYLLKAGYYPEPLQNALRWANVIVTDLPFLPRLRTESPQFLLSHNLEHKLLAQQMGLISSLFARWTRLLETQVMAKFAGAFACAPEDLQFFQAHNHQHKPLLLVENGIDAELYRPDPALRQLWRSRLGYQEEDLVIVFSGSSFAPNQEALQSLLKFIRQHAVWLTAEKIHFLILGSVSPAFREAQVQATGFVEQPIPYFQAADFAINPVQRGSGSNVKLYEYLASQVPILSTAFGVRGSRLQADKDYLEFHWDNLLEVLGSLKTRHNRKAWRELSRDLWQREQQLADMQNIVRRQWHAMLAQSEQHSRDLAQAHGQPLIDGAHAVQKS